MIEVHFRVRVETGPPAQLALMKEGHTTGDLPDAQVGIDCGFKISVLDERSAVVQGDTGVCVFMLCVCVFVCVSVLDECTHIRAGVGRDVGV